MPIPSAEYAPAQRNRVLAQIIHREPGKCQYLQSSFVFLDFLHTSEITQNHKSSSCCLQYANTVTNPRVIESPRGTTFGMREASTSPISNPQEAGHQPSTQPPGRAGHPHPFQGEEYARERTHLLAELPGDFCFHYTHGQTCSNKPKCWFQFRPSKEGLRRSSHPNVPAIHQIFSKRQEEKSRYPSINPELLPSSALVSPYTSQVGWFGSS